jgi:hydrogenase maturation protein HypF
VRERLRVVVTGAVQGVGFRPFVYRLALALRIEGWVRNSPQGVFIEVEGDHPALDSFLARLLADRPPRAVIQGLETSWLDPCGHAGFEILESATDGALVAVVLPDIATCDDCLAEIFDPSDRRYRYPFTNCTNCGPRFSIIESLPYDRPGTSMKGFTMCDACRREYDDPCNRRFHAQPNACPACGPRLTLLDEHGNAVATADAALGDAAAAIREGRIVAVKGLGGFHLVVRADDEAAVQRLRARKHREEKPFALLFPSLADVGRASVVSPAEARLLTSPESPIVLLQRRDHPACTVAASVAPRNPTLGVMLPCTPLHHLLIRAVNAPVVATSGNLSDEPICTDERGAVERLGGIADLFLVHDRPIVRHVDDSIVRVVLDRELVLRRARGYAPLPIPLRRPAPPLLAVGAHLKNTVAITAGPNVFISQHIGDLETRQALAAFRQVIQSLCTLYRSNPVRVVTDLHPDYVSTRHAKTLGLPVVAVQHHYAHVAACMADNDLDGRVLGVSWDGTGYGSDGSVWGGEFLLTDDKGFERVATLRPFRLPGGERAVREPRRAALGLLYALHGAAVGSREDLPTVAAFEPATRALLVQALERELNAPLTTSAGRLFDAVASLTGSRQTSTFEGQAAMELEAALDARAVDAYPFVLTDDGAAFAGPPWKAPATVVDWQPMVEAILADVAAQVPVGVISGRFHASLAKMIVRVALRVGEPRVVLTGGCFQNRRLIELAVQGLRDAGFRPYWHQRVPPNDGGISLGQIAGCLRALQS